MQTALESTHLYDQGIVPSPPLANSLFIDLLSTRGILEVLVKLHV